MRWSYKTVHYEMKKEGLLGSAFLDESEIELSLNEYGKSGWELVSMLETLDGLIAVFKQPLSLDIRSGSRLEREPEQQVDLPKPVKDDRAAQVESRRFEEKKGRDQAGRKVVLIEDYEEEREEPKVEVDEPPPDSSDIGSIRIE